MSEEHNKYINEWRKNNPEKTKATNDKSHLKRREVDLKRAKERRLTDKLFVENKRNYNLKRLYNITIEDYNNIFNNQNGYCAICGKHQLEFKRAFAVDHDHITGKVRGLLCMKCNADLGIYENKKIIFENYLN
jgi:hypothetical protein